MLTCVACFYNSFRSTVSTPYAFFFFNDTATTEIYTLSLHDALPISARRRCSPPRRVRAAAPRTPPARSSATPAARRDRKSTRLNSSHTVISYAVFCLKKKKIVAQTLKTTEYYTFHD